MKKITCLLVVGLLWISNVLLASNMGFKLNRVLTKTSGRTNTNWVSLPFLWIPGATSNTVCTDIGSAASEVGKYSESTDTFTTFVCGGFDTPFNINPGEAIYVKPTTNNTSWIIVGAHDDTFVVNLKKTPGRTNTNWVSIPYHATAATSQDLCTQIPAATEIGKYNESTDTFTTFVCGGFDTSFNLVAGEAVYIKVTTDNTAWTPSHY
jgi:hypothetical protein